MSLGTVVADKEIVTGAYAAALLVQNHPARHQRCKAAMGYCYVWMLLLILMSQHLRQRHRFTCSLPPSSRGQSS
jgi:hypothetical protein